MKIGLISDTHGYLDENTLSYFSGVDEIWHAGDIGNNAVYNTLSNYKPSRFVYGNIDDQSIRHVAPEIQCFDCEGARVLLIHIGGSPGKYTSRAKSLIKEHNPQIFICGHSHILRVMTDKSHNNMLYMNPGAAGLSGFHIMRTILRFEITEGKVRNLQAIELGLRAKKKQD